jgi:hypothetical protein
MDPTQPLDAEDEAELPHALQLDPGTIVDE